MTTTRATFSLPAKSSFGAPTRQRCVGSRQRDPNPNDNSLLRKDTPTYCYKGFHSTFAALLSH